MSTAPSTTPPDKSPDRPSPEIEQLAQILQRGLGARSKWALRAAADAAATNGIGGMLVIHIPPNTRDHTDLTFTIGSVEFVGRWAS